MNSNQHQTNFKLNQIKFVLFFFIVAFSCFAGIGCLPAEATSLQSNPDAELAYEYVREAWAEELYSQFETPYQRDCEKDDVFIAILSSDRYREVTGTYDRSIFTTLEDEEQYCNFSADGESSDCSNGHWEPIRAHTSLISVPESLDNNTRRHVYFHEMIHFFAYCTGYDRNGGDHDDKRIFEGTFSLLNQAIRNCQNDHAYVSDDASISEMEVNGIGVCPW